MKNANRLLSLILALVLCLAMTACASEEDKAFEAADALLAAGDYEGAIDAFSSIPRYQEISAKIEEAEKLRNEANMGFLFGKWFGIEGNYSLTLNPDGTGILDLGGEVYNANYTYENNTVTISQPLVIELKVEEQNGVTHLIWGPENWDFVSEADYSAFAPYDVEITLDNWQEYFEMRRADDVNFNGFGEPEYRAAGYGFFLKDEYMQKLVQQNQGYKVSLEVQYDEAWFTVSGDFLAGSYELTPSDKPRWHSDPETGLTQVIEVWDSRNIIQEYKDDFSGAVAASFTPSYTIENNGIDGIVYYQGAENIEVIRIAGTLTFKP